METRMIEEFTDEQKAKFQLYIDKWSKVGETVEKVDHVNACEELFKLYELCGYEKPAIKWVKSPIQMWEAVKEWDKENNEVTSINDFISGLMYGSDEAAWMAFYDFLYTEFPDKREGLETIPFLVEVCKSCGWLYPGEKLIIASERPTMINRDEQGRLHSFDKPSVAFEDGWNEYTIHGVKVPKFVVEDPKSITVEILNNETNAELKRIMMDIFGKDRYIREGGAKLIDDDKRWGKLYKIEMGNGDDPIMTVEVKDPFASLKDGSNKTYFLSVPHHEDVDPLGLIEGEMKRAKQAVAWTFEKRESEYNPIVES